MSSNFAWVLYNLNTLHFCINKVFVTGKSLMTWSYLEVSLKICKGVFKYQILLQYRFDETCHLKPGSCPFLLLFFYFKLGILRKVSRLGIYAQPQNLGCSFQDFSLFKLCMQTNLYYHFYSKTYTHKWGTTSYLNAKR